MVPVMIVAACGVASADLVFTITGNPGSPAMMLSGGGTILSTGSPGSDSNSSFLQVPDGTPEWQGARNNIGDYLAGTWINFGSEGRELALAGDLRLVGTGSSTFSFTFNHLRMDDDVAIGGDDLDLRFDSAQSYPDYPSGLMLSLEGASTFNLGDGNTFDDLIQGTYSLTGYGVGGASRIDFVIMQAVPEPSSFVLMGLFTGLCFRRRRGRVG